MADRVQAGSNKLDLTQREREAREKFLASRKLKSLEAPMKQELPTKDESTEVAQPSPMIPSLTLSTLQPVSQAQESTSSNKKKKNKKRKSETEDNPTSKLTPEQKVKKKAKKRAKKG